MVKSLFAYTFIMMCFCSFAQEGTVHPINTGLKGNTYSPTFYRDYFVVCSDQKDRFLNTVLDVTDAKTTDLYIITDTSGSYLRFDDNLRSEFNEGPTTFNKSGSYMIMSRNLYTNISIGKSQFNKNPMALFESDFKSARWSQPKVLSFIDSSYQYMHPALNPDGTKLVFASNCPGGYGGFDIWISYHSDAGWSAPINAGPRINTVNNEVFPTINGQSIHFSSDRRGLGGLDIYNYDTLAKMSQILEAPINSVFDDFGLVIKPKTTHAYFSSDRNGLDEIWALKIIEDDPVVCDTIIANNLCYTLSEAQAVELGEVENLVYIWNLNNEKIEGISIDYCFPGEGGYEISLDIIDTVVNQTFFNQSYYYLEIAFAEQPYITSPDTVLIGETFEISAEESKLPGAIILSNEWSFSDGQKRYGKLFDHSFEETGDYRLELTVEMNVNDSVIYDCVYKVIHCLNERVAVENPDLANVIDDTSKIKNEELFFAEKNDSNVVYSIEVIRTKEKLSNDNFLFKLMETYGEVKIHFNKEKGEYSYLIGEWKTIEDAHPVWKGLIEEGYDEAVVRTIDLELVSRFSLDNSFELDNVRFDEGMWDIRPDAIPDLENIIEIMLVFPDIKLNIQAHTNSRGEEDANLELSIKRAESVKGFIVSKGVDPSRISAEGLGETQPKLSNDTPEGLKANRRVEFTFLK